MNHRPLMAVFGLTLFSSAFLIFSVQPMVGKLLLPLLGGSPSVWNTAMVFFQAMLLLGYTYAHLVARYLSLPVQVILHIALLLGCVVFLPIALPVNVIPPVEGQAWWQLGLMLTMVGGPFFILAASAPLFQHWFASSRHPDAQNPYFLYAISNAGSMAALLGYPILIEPFLSLPGQGNVWLGCYIFLTLLTAICGFSIYKGVKPVHQPETGDGTLAPTWRIRGFWLLLAFIPSSLLLGVTTHITTDIASVPLFWIIPLALYLLTFIVAFGRREIVGLTTLRDLAGYGLCLIFLTYVYVAFKTSPLFFVLFHLIGFTACAQFCHSQLAALKPSPAFLTEFFLLISLGGVMGGIFNALLAPQLFSSALEYPLILALAGFILWYTAPKKNIGEPKKRNQVLMLDFAIVCICLAACAVAMTAANHNIQVICSVGIIFAMFVAVPNRMVFALFFACALFLFDDYKMWAKERAVLAMERDYFGIMTVYDHGTTHTLEHGTTMHGAQYMDGRRLMPTTYYSPKGPAAEIFYNLDKRPENVRIAALGLGVGSILCYGGADRQFDIYEISKAVVDIAEDPRYFTYLKDCGSPYQTILGDARLKMKEAPNVHYDLIFVDTFSSDNIPVHIMTEEAVWTYLSKLKPGGIIAFHISNRYLDLRYPLSAIAADMGLVAAFKFQSIDDTNKTNPQDTSSLYVIFARNEQDMSYFLKEKEWDLLPPKPGFRPWTDDYANILASFQFLYKYD